MGQTNNVLADPGKGATTRDMLLDAAERSVLEKGFGATSIEEPRLGSARAVFFTTLKTKVNWLRTFYVATSSARTPFSIICLIAPMN